MQMALSPSSKYGQAETSRDDLLYLLATNPSVWLETLTTLDGEPTKLEPYQIRFLNDQSNFRIVNKARQIGFSTALSAETTFKAATQRNYKANIVSINQKEAGDKVDIARALYHSIPDEFKETNPVLKPVLWTDADNEISFHRPPDTSAIISQPASSAIRGGKKDIYFDEFAHIRDAKKLYKAAMPAITRGDTRITIVSTPLAQSGMFFDIFEDEKQYANYSRHIVPWWECSVMVRPGAIEEAMGRAHGMGTEDRVREFATDKLISIFEEFGSDIVGFRTEYECEFEDETSAYYTWDLVKECIDPERSVWRDWFYPYEPLGYLTVGVDLARDKDQTVITVVDNYEDEDGNTIRKVLMCKPMQDPYNEQFDYLKKLVETIKPQRVTIDQTGVGQKFVEDARRLITGNIEGVVFTNQRKERWATSLKGDMQVGLVSWPNHPDLTRQIHGIRRTKTEANFYKFAGAKDDFFWSMVLALYGDARRPPRMGFAGGPWSHETGAS